VNQNYHSLLSAPQVGAGSAYASSVTLTDVSPVPQTIVPANGLTPGAILRLTSFGVFSTTGTPTLLLGFYWGGVAGVALAATLANATGSGVANVPWRLELDVICRTAGSAGTVMCQGKAFIGTSVSAWAVAPLPQIALATVAVDTTAAKAVTVGAQWGTNSASNTLTCHSGVILESIG
jgi:hypothetical protein